MFCGIQLSSDRREDITHLASENWSKSWLIYKCNDSQQKIDLSIVSSPLAPFSWSALLLSPYMDGGMMVVEAAVSRSCKSFRSSQDV